MPRRKEAPSGRISPRRSRRESRKPQALMDIVVGAVRRLGALMGVSVTDIEHCAVAEGDLPARAGARSILRLGLNRAVETGRLQRTPGGLFRLPDQQDAAALAAENKMEEQLIDVSRASDDSSSERVTSRSSLLESRSATSVADSDQVGRADEIVNTGGVLNQAMHLPGQHAVSFHLRDDRLDLDETGHQFPRGGQTPDNRLVCSERTAADHGRAAAAGLFKLSADVIAVIAQTASRRLNTISNDASSSRPQQEEDDVSMAYDYASGQPSMSKGEDGARDEGSGTSVASDTVRIVGATGAALSQIAAAASKGSTDVITVASAAEDPEDSGASTATRDNIFRSFKEAAMDIVRAARAFGEALGSAEMVKNPERPDSGRSEDSLREDLYDSLPLNVGPDLSAGYSGPVLDMEDFLRDLLQDVRQLAQRVGKCIK